MDAMLNQIVGGAMGQAAHAAMTLATVAAFLLMGAWAAASIAVVTAGKRR